MMMEVPMTEVTTMEVKMTAVMKTIAMTVGTDRTAADGLFRTAI